MQVTKPNQTVAAVQQVLKPNQTEAEVEQVTYQNQTQPAVLQVTNHDQEQFNTYLLFKDFILQDVPGDGHCLLHAVIVSLKSQSINVSHEQLVDTLCKIKENMEFYQQFSGRMEIPAKLESYIQSKNYNTNTADIFLNVLCNALGLHTVEYLIPGGTITSLHQSPRQESNM